MTFIEYYQDRFDKQPSAENIKTIAEIISWNLWQMDGLKDTVPFGTVYCKIQDWHSCEDRIIEYRTMKGNK